MAVDWTQLPPELIELISKNLTIYADYLRFRAVCQSWRFSVLKAPCHLPPQLPWLMLPQSQSRSHQSQRAFFNLSNNKTHFLNLPEASNRKRPCGSSQGWLVILDETPDILIVNPLTRSKFHLPPLSTFPNVLSFNYSEIGREYTLKTLSGELYTANLRQMRDSFIKKVVLSSSPLESTEFVALAILNQSGNLAFCKNGDQSWSFIVDIHSYCEDVIYNNGLFYAVNKQGSIAICDIHGPSLPRVSLVETGKQFDGDIQYLVQSGNELLLVNRFLDLQYDLNIVGDYSNIVYRTVGFQVFKMDRSCPEWRQIMNLDNQVLFLGENSSLSLSASDFPGCLGNCIYYTDDYSEFNYAGAFGKHDLGIFRLCDASIEPLPCYPLNSYAQLGWPPPLWITPNPC